ncbi:MAG: hypothetical protein ABIL58_10150 [Pseudomonadota bacterium]
MKDILKRDITGECVGECKDTVNEGYRNRQSAINAEGGDWPDTFPRVSSASARNAPPGFLGGHV